MILSDQLILKEIEAGTIVIEPFKRECLGTNSYDVHLGKHLACYKNRLLDAKKHNEIDHFEIPKDGFVLHPNTLYLGVTLEYTETHKHVPFLEGKSILINHPHHISLSHSYDYAAVMVSKTKKVGIDIEIIKTKIDRIKHKFLAVNELAFINSENAVEHLYACWCAKEALYKLNGKKETSFKDHIHLSSFNYHEAGEIEATIEKSTHQDTFTVKYQKFENYLLGYVCE